MVVQGRRRVTALYEKKNVGGFHLKSEMTLKQYNAFFKQYNKRGFKLVYLNPEFPISTCLGGFRSPFPMKTS